MSDTYTPAEYEWARRYVISDTENPDFLGVGEMFEEEWTGLTEEEFDARMRRVHDLACSAKVTVSWPHEQTGDDQPVYPAPGSAIPGQPGYVVGECEHRVAESEWRAGCRNCERCGA